MLKSREEVSKLLQKQIKKNFTKPQNLHDFTEQLETKYDIPSGLCSDIFSLRVRPEDVSDFIIFAFLSVLTEDNTDFLAKIFTEDEIKTYSTSRYQRKELKFPIKFPMVEIVPDQQYIGTISLEDLMVMRDASIIRYNESTQRTMRRMIEGNTVYYEISIDRQVVAQIKEAILGNTYIPTTLTFNMPEDAVFSFKKLDEKEFGNLGVLTISDSKFIDIIDGYHRYVALSQIFDMNRNFPYDMEIRITSFPESKAKQFIWQEDQKTKMKKIDSESLNQTSQAVKMVQQINSDSSFVLAGQIDRNGGKINYSYLVSIIDNMFFSASIRRGLNKTTAVQYFIDSKKRIQNLLNEVIYYNSDVEWTYRFTLLAIFIARKGGDADDLFRFDNYMSESGEKYSYILPKGTQLAATTYSRIEKIYDEWRATL